MSKPKTEDDFPPGRPNRPARPSLSRTGSVKTSPDFSEPQRGQWLAGITTESFPNRAPNRPRKVSTVRGSTFHNWRRRQLCPSESSAPRSMTRAMSDLVLESALTCPTCGHVEVATMPTDACQFFYECPSCHAILRPKPGDCCVFCSYGSVRCPPKQTGGNCCE